MKREYDYRDTYVKRLTIAAILILLFCLDAYLVSTGRTQAIDDSVGEAVRSLRKPFLNTFFTFITAFGSASTIVSVGIVILVADIIKWRRPDYPLAVGGALLTLGLYELVKKIIQRPRPDEVFWIIEEEGFSFPSGHTTNSACCYGLILYLIWRNIENKKIRYIAASALTLLIVLIGFSRIYCGVHYLCDVLGGFLLGTSSLLVITVAIDEMLLRMETKK